MSGRVHQEDEDKLKATVKQKEKDRTVTGSVTANAGTNLDTSGLAITNPETDDNSIPAGESRETVNVLLHGYENVVGTNWQRVRITDAGKLKVDAAFNPETDDDSISTGGNRETTNILLYGYNGTTWERLKTDNSNQLLVTQSGAVTANPTPFSTILGSAITLTDADQDYKLPGTEQSGRIVLVIYNISDTTVYIGGAGVETTDGTPLASSKYMVIPASANVYAVCGDAGKTLRLIECK